MADVPNYLEVARVLQGRLRERTASESATQWRELLEFAAAEFHVPKGKFVHSRKRSKTPRREEDERNVGGEKACRHVCCEHEEFMKPDRWGTLPHELLQLAFARLPVSKILDLQCLSKDWRESLGARGDSEFLRACDEAHPKMFALVSKVEDHEGPGTLFLVRVLDTKLNAWHAFQVSSLDPERDWPVRHLRPRWRTLSCEDGGLVLFDMEAHRVPMRKTSFRSYFFKVINPLTGYEYDLPPILDVGNIHMNHILVDRETNSYEVLIVVNRGGTAREDIQVFQRETGRWSQPSEARNVMFGNQSAYDFARGRLIEPHGSERSPWNEEKVQCHAFLKNRLFVLLKDTNAPGSEVRPTNQPREAYRIKEYVVEYHPEHPPTWLEVDVHNCVPFKNTPKSSSYGLILLSSNGFLVVFVALNELDPWRNDKGWLYDLSTRTWRVLPKLPGDEHMWLHTHKTCEIRWNAHP